MLLRALIIQLNISCAPRMSRALCRGWRWKASAHFHSSLWRTRNGSFHHNTLSVRQKNPHVPWEQRGEELAGVSGKGFLELSLQVASRNNARGPQQKQSSWSTGAPRNLRLQDRVYPEDTYRGAAGDTTTAEEELILVHNYGCVPVTQRETQ